MFISPDDCAGSLVSPRTVLTAFHCLQGRNADSQPELCDHKDRRRRVVIGIGRGRQSNYSIPIMGVRVASLIAEYFQLSRLTTGPACCGNYHNSPYT